MASVHVVLAASPGHPGPSLQPLGRQSYTPYSSAAEPSSQTQHAHELPNPSDQVLLMPDFQSKAEHVCAFCLLPFHSANLKRALKDGYIALCCLFTCLRCPQVCFLESKSKDNSNPTYLQARQAQPSQQERDTQQAGDLSAQTGRPRRNRKRGKNSQHYQAGQSSAGSSQYYQQVASP